MMQTKLETIEHEVLQDMLAEVRRVDTIRGDDLETAWGTSAARWGAAEAAARADYDGAERAGVPTMALALREEAFEALAEENPEALYRELLQVAATAIRFARAVRGRPR